MLEPIGRLTVEIPSPIGLLECRIQNWGTEYKCVVATYDRHGDMAMFTTLCVQITLRYNNAGQLYWADRRKLVNPELWEWIVLQVANVILVNS